MEPGTLSASSPKVYYAIIAVLFGVVGRFSVALYHARRRVIACKKDGLGMPPHHPVFGHLLVAQKILSKIPNDAHPLYMPIHIRREYPEVGPLFYIDLWPFSDPFLVVASPSAAYQLLQEHPQPKADVVRNFMYPMTRNHDLVTMEGKQWREWRNVFSPGFSAAHLTSLVPQILEQVVIYTQVLEEHAKAKDIFQLEKATIGLTIDVIGIVTLGSHFNAQRSDNPFVSALRNMILWLPSGSELNPFVRWNPLRPFAQRYYNRQMDDYLSREIKSCFQNHRSPNNRNAKTILGLAIDRYLADNKASAGSDELDPTFIPFAMAQLKGLILAGHGTTANTICYCYHNLSSHPEALATIRAEHSDVLGPDPAKAILETPHLLNQLPYTIAIIKETLRLFPADASPRRGNRDFFLRENGKAYPTDKCMVWSMPQAVHRTPEWWPRPDEFVPERFVVPEGDPLHPVKGAWRAFEFGPRNCVGQELALLEMKITLAMTIRRLEVRAVYEEWEGVMGMAGRNVSGEKGYQVLDGTNRPRGGFPCRVGMVDGR